MYFECLVTGVSEPKKSKKGDKEFQTVYLTDCFNERWTAFMPDNFESYLFEKEDDNAHRKFCWVHVYNSKKDDGWVTNIYISYAPVKF